ncbi:hypothetical protein GXP67_13210 [Rhodocytophaga rosea]|uniref:Carbohydrate-binding domain-containing protein n=1 Tax=Rhodocytophaga rosea TaxID=2704465 RepID=A0A6C0GHT8_9BACT|nr:carbohydrate-binding family 9-like protein [Rhodocytophaga rosea]QHT67517.1 hypothetical protein GXP67_13210 [Rhodocytophaga rosea]
MSIHENTPPVHPADPLTIKKTSDFTITGDGTASNWQQTDWVTIPVRQNLDNPHATRIKILYSEKGMYFLFLCEDTKLTSTITEDFGDLYNEDVVEVFLWTDEKHPIYFEYEVSPLNYELPIIVPNNGRNFFGWRPWKYEGDRKTQHQTSVQGGKKESNATVKSWMAEFFIPYTLLSPLNNVPPKSQTKWRANFYRIDYDDKKYTTWQWQPTSGSFHEYQKYGTIVFE